MNKKMAFIVLLLLTMLCGCANEHETIEIYSKDDLIFDDININLKSGYWVKDYSIDYENNVVVLNLYQD